MFLEFYGLKREPFGVTPDPRFLFPTATHREALAAIHYGIEAGRGFLALMAPPGMGKTTLLFRLLKHLQGSARTVFLFQTISSPTDLMRYLLMDQGVEHLRNMVSMHRELNQILLNEANEGRRFVLVIDEAQNLSEPVLEAARVLSNFETPTSKLMQIVLSGQPELGAKLNRPSMSQLRQRISIFIRLEPFKPEESIAYIEHRVNVAGHEGPPIFTRAAMELIAEHSRGIPRNINNLCANSLSLGFAVEQAMIGPGVVRRVLADLCVRSPENPTAHKAMAAKAGAESGGPEPPAQAAEPRPREAVLDSSNRVFTPLHLRPRPLPTSEPGLQPGTTVNAAAKVVCDAKLQLSVMRPGPSASLVPLPPKTQAPAAVLPAGKTKEIEIPIGERLRWPASSLTMMGGRGAALALAPQRSVPVSDSKSVTEPLPEVRAAPPASQPEPPAALQTPASAGSGVLLAENVREIRFGERFSLRVSSPSSSSAERPAGLKREPRLNHSQLVKGYSVARAFTEQRFFSKASWALISLAFLLTLYVSTKFWFNEPEVPAANPAAVASAQQGEPSERTELVSHVVQPNETLEGIARSYFGHWDGAVRAEIFRLNPHLNAKHLRVGQQILMPRRIPNRPRKPRLKTKRAPEGNLTAANRTCCKGLISGCPRRSQSELC
jgi:type II secretory pathway predicted ATPase ExeA